MAQTVAVQIDGVVKHIAALTQRAISETAKSQHKEIMGRAPRPLNFVRHVDGVEGASEDAVKLNGIIVYDYNRLDIVAKRAIEILQEFSPVGSGRDPHPGLYRNSHRLFVDGHAVKDLKGWSKGQEISITNTVIYAQMIELGGKGGRKFKIDGGGRVYQRAAQRLRRDPDVANAAKIDFTFRAVLGSEQVNQATKGRGGRGGSRAHNKAEVRWPTIVIRPA